MDELKNLVIQSLETNGVLGQVRAQLRSSVFKVIDNQDQVEQKKSNFHFSNPKAKQLRESKQGSLMAELIQEFLEFYRLDYSLAIFKPETNLGTGKVDKASLAEKAGIHGQDLTQPLLLTLLNAFNSGEVGSGATSAPPVTTHNTRDEFNEIQPLSYGGLPKERSSTKGPIDSQDNHLAKANNLLAELDREEKSGFNLNSQREGDESSDKDMGLSGRDKKAGVNGGISKEDPSINDNYDDDFDDDIDEDLPEDDPMQDDADLNARSANIGGSGQGITVSQSLGVDPSVDSMALEDYDHVEPVERIA